METATPSLAGLSREEKLALLRRLAGGGAGQQARPAGEARAADERPDGPREYPASFAQRRLWFLERLAPEDAAHNNIFRAVRLAGPLDREALGRALAGLVRRHDALRTRFAEAEGEPVQVVEPAAAATAAPLRRVALAELDPEAREEALQALARAEAATPFDLARAPLARFTLVELGADAAALLVTLHHAVADGWSLAIVFRELSELYRAEAEGAPAKLPTLPVTYGAHARGQRQRLSGDGLAAELEHWKAELAGAPEVLDLPTDRPRPALATFRGGTAPFELPAPAAEALRRLAREERATPFAALLASFAAVLRRWSGQDDLLLGVPVAGRPEPELEGVVGFFANTLVVRAELHGRPTFRELLRRARRRTLAALAHQEVPFEHLVEELRPRRDLSRNPLFQAMFALQTMPRAALSLGAARIEPLAVERGLAKVDLTLDLVERDGRLLGYLEHNLDLFDRTTATRLAAHVRRLVEAVAADPDRPLDEVELLTPAERHLLLPEGRGPARALPAGDTVDALIRRRAAADPDRPAVQSGGGSWTYGQLRRAAGRVARELAARGLAPGDRVAVRAGRSREAVAAFLGVLEAGCAYVPLDPEYPEERLAFMLRDSGARVLVSGPLPETARGRTGELAAAAGEGIAFVTLDADGLADAGGPEAPEAPDARHHPEQAAYVLYTSGTTGRPKGVVIPHGALLNHALAAAEAYGLGPQDRVLQFASTSFDIAGEEIFPTLLSGAALTLRPEGVAPSPAELAAFVAEHRLSVVNVPTPLWHEWVAELADGHAAP
ncbi:MAG TPA: condensation domain-containing protein, partial [Thermoanaerobaculia bacterium]